MNWKNLNLSRGSQQLQQLVQYFVNVVIDFSLLMNRFCQKLQDMKQLKFHFHIELNFFFAIGNNYYGSLFMKKKKKKAIIIMTGWHLKD